MREDQVTAGPRCTRWGVDTDVGGYVGRNVVVEEEEEEEEEEQEAVFIRGKHK